MRRVIAGACIALAALAGPATAQGDGKYGYRAAEFVKMPPNLRIAYAYGVADALDIAGLRCPDPSKTKMSIILSRTDAKIYEYWDQRETTWAGAMMILVYFDLGCRMSQ